MNPQIMAMLPMLFKQMGLGGSGGGSAGPSGGQMPMSPQRGMSTDQRVGMFNGVKDAFGPNSQFMMSALGGAGGGAGGGAQPQPQTQPSMAGLNTGTNVPWQRDNTFDAPGASITNNPSTNMQGQPGQQMPRKPQNFMQGLLGNY